MDGDLVVTEESTDVGASQAISVEVVDRQGQVRAIAVQIAERSAGLNRRLAC